ncbi:MAG: hypothetical protein ABMA25_09740 [Ilumatobacteraceae bacterium]
MTSDPFDLLARMATSDGSLERGVDTVADELLDRILASESGTPNEPPIPTATIVGRSSQRKVLTIAVVTAALAIGGTVAATSLLRTTPDATTVVCYSDASPEPAVTVGLPLSPGATPVEQCAGLWSDGTFATDGTELLVACVTDQEMTAVVPGRFDTCSTLGWQPAAPPTPSDVLDQQVADAVPDLFATCIADLEVARHRVERLLLEMGDAGTWSVVVEGAVSSERPCAANVIDASRHEIRIVAFQLPPG